MKKLLLLMLITAMPAFAEYPYTFYNPDLPLPITVFSQRYSKTTPFWIRIGTEKYYLVKNREDKNYTYNDLVGCGEAKSRLFEPFFEINTDRDYKTLSASELLSAKIRFVSEKTNGKLALEEPSKDYVLDENAYIDLMTLGVFQDEYHRPSGNFTLYIKSERGNLRKYTGHVNYQHPRRLKLLF